jgi:hypothetical protein
VNATLNKLRFLWRVYRILCSNPGRNFELREIIYDNPICYLCCKPVRRDDLSILLAHTKCVSLRENYI